MNRERIFQCLGEIPYAALVDATTLSSARRHAFVDLDHWAVCLLQRERSDFSLLLDHCGYSPSEARRGFERALDGYSTGGDSVRDISAALENTIGPAVIWSRIAAASSKVRSGHLMLAWLEDEQTGRWLRSRLGRHGPAFDTDALAHYYEAHAGTWMEASGAAPVNLSASSAKAGAEREEEVLDALEKWGTCLTRQAEKGELDPVIGRDDELRTVIDILSRRRQNNPILVGEAGVGKTAIAEGLAQRIHAGAVPPGLHEAQVWALDLARLQAGAGVRGEFEQRLKSVMDAVVAAPCPIILFCDETHTLVGAGGAAGTGDAANMIKPMLARGQLRMVAATTWSEYKQHIEPDAALVRRFQTVQVDEPDDATAIDMLRCIAPRFAAHHHVQIADTAIRGAVTLSRRYLPARQLPDKAISLLDTACARVAMSQSCTPAALEDLRHQAHALEQALAWRASDRRLGVPDTPNDEASLIERRDHLLEQAVTLEALASKQREAVRSRLANIASGGATDTPAARVLAPEAITPDDQEHEACLVHAWVDEQSIAEVLADWTGVPVTQMARDDAQRVVELEAELSDAICGQPGGMHAIAQALQVSRAGLNDPRRPLGVMLLAGPTGTGKSQTAIRLAELLFGGERHLLQFNMNEFQEAHTASTLRGAPPGYVGYGKGGRLTEAIRKKPYSVLLLDEFDRAHPDIHEVFYQVFDQGWMEDGEGRRISFRNCLVLLTTNLGSPEIEATCQADPEVSQAKLDALVRDRLRERFSPSLLARLQVVTFRPLSLDALIDIAWHALDEIGQILAQNKLSWHVADDVADWIGRAIEHHPAHGRAARDLLRQHLMPNIARGVLQAHADNRPLVGVQLSINEGGLSLSFDDGSTVAHASIGTLDTPAAQSCETDADAPPIDSSAQIADAQCEGTDLTPTALPEDTHETRAEPGTQGEPACA